MIYWRCEGTIAKYNRPCPQKLMFFSEAAMKEYGLTKEVLQKVISIKCPRCGEVAGVKVDTAGL